MSVFVLPSVRLPMIHAVEGDVEEVIINESLLEYIHQLQHMKNDTYCKLSSVCGVNEPIHYFKYLEVFQTFPFHRSPLRTHFFGNANCPSLKSFQRVRGALKDVYDADVGDADLVVCETVDHTPTLLFSCVQAVLRNQKKDGSLILHVRELFGVGIVQVMYILAACYKTVSIYTPMVHSGQTKFIVASHLYQNIDLPGPPPYAFKPTQFFLVKLIEINTMIGQKRLEQTRFNTTCDYECVIWKSKFFSGFHDVHLDAHGRGNKVQERTKTPHGNTVN
jgi:hypothetical protein